MEIRPPEPRSAARILRRELATLGLELKYTQALNVVAKLLGFQNFHALRAQLGAQPAKVAVPEDQVFVATYEHRHGRDVCVFRTEAGVETWRTSIAKEYWAEESDDEAPADDVIADAYFDKMSEREREWFTVETAVVIGA
jgi:hypothetical protein